MARPLRAIVIVDADRGMAKDDFKIVDFQSLEDFIYNKTVNEVVIVGRRTWETLKERPLKDRANVVISSSLLLTPSLIDNTPRTQFLKSSESLSGYLNIQFPNAYPWVLGGAETVERLLPQIIEVHLLELEFRAFATKLFPPLPETEWEKTESNLIEDKEVGQFYHTVYKRKADS
jgi:dihydrofolate reductase